MTIQFTAPWITGKMEVPDSLAEFGLWLVKNRQSKRAESICVLIAEHDRENDLVERENIRRTITEILYDQTNKSKPKI